MSSQFKRQRFIRVDNELANFAWLGSNLQKLQIVDPHLPDFRELAKFD